MIQKETMLAYPKFGETFHVYADASDTQLGGVIMQNGKPLAFDTSKLNHAQSKYTTGEQQLLSLVKTLKSFENIIMGQKLETGSSYRSSESFIQKTCISASNLMANVA